MIPGHAQDLPLFAPYAVCFTIDRPVLLIKLLQVGDIRRTHHQKRPLFHFTGIVGLSEQSKSDA